MRILSLCAVSQLLLQAADPAQTAAFLVLLRAKVNGALPCGEECRSQPKGSSASQGETPSEIAGLAQAMRNNAVKVEAGDEVLDIVGTGGDRCASPCNPPEKGAVQDAAVCAQRWDGEHIHGGLRSGCRRRRQGGSL